MAEHQPATADTNIRKSVLFVDDEERILQGLERMLRPFRHEWSMTFVGGGAEALTAMEHQHFDVLVTDMRMPGMNGVELMQHVLERHPHVIRIALSGHAERDVVVRAVRLAHQYLSKPCEANLLKERLTQALRLRTLMQSPTLQSVLCGVSGLRTVPSLYVEMMAEMQAPNPSVARVAAVIANDPGMTAKVLQLINSAYFGLRAYVCDPERAVQLLGLDTVKSLVLSVQVFSHFEKSGRGANPAQMWQHSMRVARLAKELARRMNLDDRGVHEAFTAGLLHDVGKMVLMEAIPEYEGRLSAVWRATPDADLLTVERQAFGASHAEVGSYLFGLWGLPYGIVEAIAGHHRPSDSNVPGCCPLTALYAANVLDHAAFPETQLSAAPDDSYLVSLGLQDAIRRWTPLAVEMAAA
jgi:putative nucleotidyltransferase with HDIG domain